MNCQLKTTINKVFKVNLDAPTKKGNHAIARHLYCYIRHNTTKLTFDDIGAEIEKDRTTAYYSIGKIQDVLDNPKDKYHTECNYIYELYSDVDIIEDIDYKKDKLIAKLLNKIRDLKQEIEEIKAPKPEPTILDHLKQLPEDVQENVMFRLNSIVKMESSKVMNYRESVKV